jgi:hypothetical protein
MQKGVFIVNTYEITNMIIDDDFDSEEYVTTEFTHNQMDYSITFKKADLEIMNAWVFKDGTSLPADLPDTLIESIREDVKKRI